MSKDFFISCKNCGSLKTSIKKSEALRLSSNFSCKSCGKSLFEHYEKPFLDLSPAAFIHKLDRQMLDALQKIPGIDSILRTVLRHSMELSMRLHHQANFVQASKKQLKKLYGTLETAAQILDIKTLPELYVVQDSRVNAYTFGVEKCSVAISSGCFDLLSDREILSVMAHELGHIKASHVLYKTASRIFATLAESLAQRTFGLGGFVLYPIQLALLRWDRASELSADRASLLVVKEPNVVLNSLMKLAGGSKNLLKELSLDAFIKQAESFEKTQSEGPLGKYMAVMNSMFNTHPFPIWRAREIIEWVTSGEYFSLLQGNYLRSPESEPRYCSFCGSSIETNNNVCPKCSHEAVKENPYGEKLDKTIDSLKSWYERNFVDSGD